MANRTSAKTRSVAADANLNSEWADKNLDYLEGVHLLVPRSHSSGYLNLMDVTKRRVEAARQVIATGAASSGADEQKRASV
jgi:hypothetical protein